MDVVDRLEARGQAEPVEHAIGIGRVGDGEDDLAPGQPTDRRRERGVFLEHVHLDIMDEGEEFVRVDVMFRHQPGQRRAMGQKILLLKTMRGGVVDVETIGDIGRHLRGDAREQHRTRRVQRVVEIENPVADMAETREHGVGP